MTRLQLLFLAIAAAGIVGACSTAATPSESTATVEGRTFLSTGVTGIGLVPGTQVSLRFADGNLSATGGCNSMGGTYAIQDGRLQTSEGFMTEMACDEARMAQDQWLAAFLDDVAVTLDGDTLTLDDGTVRLTLLDKEVATPDQPLEGTLWVVDGIISGDAVSSVPESVTASLRIVDGQAEVHFGCNSGGGAVTLTADTLTFGPMMSTKMACEPNAMAMETAVATVLTGDVAYTIDADTLTLHAGANGLTLRASS
jgi:heat shock protein HslJ